MVVPMGWVIPLNRQRREIFTCTCLTITIFLYLFRKWFTIVYFWMCQVCIVIGLMGKVCCLFGEIMNDRIPVMSFFLVWKRSNYDSLRQITVMTTTFHQFIWYFYNLTHKQYCLAVRYLWLVNIMKCQFVKPITIRLW